uniref:Uncharacterized protein n=1 Tax=Cajanus cajan TaxID=3821 RepID=A0A151RLL5_CAJCA|nr:hypothetical protein KK1_035202 [Cajanus cajan]
MEEAEKELERRTKFLSSLIQNKKKAIEPDNDDDDGERFKVHVRACDMPLPLQNRAFHCARVHLESVPPGNKLDSKRLALALKKVTNTFSRLLIFLENFIFFNICFWGLMLIFDA